MAEEDKIRERAHQIWEAQGRPHGRDRENWEQASREIAAEKSAKPKGGRRGAAKSVAEDYRASRDSPGATGETIPAPKARTKRKPAG